MKAFNSQAPRRRGVALIVTLLVILLVTTYITEFFFETGLEIRGMQNFQSAFASQSAVKALFEAVKVGIAEEDDFMQQLKDLYLVLGGVVEAAPGSEPLDNEDPESANANYSKVNPPTKLVEISELIASKVLPGLVPPGSIPYTPYVRPIDHLFNLNRIRGDTGTREPDSEADRVVFNEFVNLFLQVSVEIESDAPPDPEIPPEFRPLELQEITPLYAAIFDWMDKDTDNAYTNAVGVEGAEAPMYVDFEPDSDLMVKNRGLDRLSELRLIEGVLESGISWETWQKHFTVHPVGKDLGSGERSPRLNVNLANQDDIINFLKRFDQESPYYAELGDAASEKQQFFQKFVDNAEDIASLLVDSDEDGDRVTYSNLREIDDALLSLDLGPAAKFFFIAYSEWYEVRLVADVGGSQSELRATIHVPRNQEGKPEGDIQVHDYIIR